MLARRDGVGRRLAFEVQWSPQSIEETRARQDRYARDGVGACWFFRKPPYKYAYELQASRDLPLFELAGGQGDTFGVTSYYLGLHRNSQIPLRGFVAYLLSGRIRFSQVVRAKREQRISLVFFNLKCWKCEKWSHIYYTRDPAEEAPSDCGCTVCARMFARGPVYLWAACGLPVSVGTVELALQPEVVHTVHEALMVGRLKGIRMGEIKRRYSYAEKRSYTSFGCRHCDALFGNTFLEERDIVNARAYGWKSAEIEIDLQLVNPPSEPWPHWCGAPDGDYCR